jgi:amino acid adenylation domain-containing protein
MQAGMLYQSLRAGAGSGFDIEQMCIDVAERIDPEAIARAFTAVVRRHPILATGFSWEGSSGLEQRVFSNVRVPFEVEDWSSSSSSEHAHLLDELLVRDRARGFDLAVPPLMRLTVLVLGESRSTLIWTFHHILIDGRSFPAVLAEAFRIYEAEREGRDADLPPPPRRYRDYIESLAKLDHGPSRVFFRQLLRGKAAPTPLPVAEPAQKPLDRSGYGRHERVIPRAIADRARALAADTATTFGTVMQAAFAMTFARHAGETDVLFGSTRACRKSALGGEAEQMVGLFINTLPVRVDASDERRVSELLACLRAANVAIRPHEHTPLVEIQAESRFGAGVPLFDAIFMYENQELNRTLRALEPALFENKTLTLFEQPSFPFNVLAFDGEELTIRVLYDRRRFRDEVVARFAESMEVALEALARDPHAKLATIEVMSERDRARVLVEWNATERPFPAEDKIHHGFERRAAAEPDRVAVEVGSKSMTFGELRRRANALARALRSRGGKPGEFVAICCDRGFDLIVALLGVAISGAAYVPIEPRYPDERLGFMIGDAKCGLVVTQRKHAHRFSGETLVLGEGLEDAEYEPLSPVGTSADPCYAIYTSGSTGKPKGVVLAHRAVVNTLDWVSREFEVRAGDRLLFVTSPCFDLSVYDVFGALGAGASVVVATESELAEPSTMASMLVDRGITIWDSAPAMLQHLVPFISPSAARAPLRLVMLSGDWIPIDLPDAVRTRFPASRVMSLGGATEAAIWSNWFPIGAIDPRWSSIPYGRPIQNARYHVLDHRRRPAPIGVPGDLYIGGTCLAEGYLARPELTAERFIADPFRGGDERLYYTGDRARYFDDGNLEFLGRIDLQAKIRGFRVELGEVESALAREPGVRDAVCTAQTDASGQKALIAHVVPEPETTLDIRAMRDALARKLPEFMVPSQIVVRDSLPITSNGKVDRNALTVPLRASRMPSLVPSSPTESALLSIWRELLGKSDIGVDDNFFELGGHSVLAIMLLGQVKQKFGVEIPLSTVLERPTIAALAASVSNTDLHSTSRHLLVLHGHGPRPPIVLVAGVGGYAFTYKNFPSLFGKDQPVMALQSIGAEDESELVERSIEEMAEIYEPEVLAASPGDRPLVLGGFSFGALPALELARRFARIGRSVPLLVSLEGYAPGYPEPLPLSQRVGAHVRELVRGDRDARAAYVRGRAKNVQARVKRWLGADVAEDPNIPFADRAMNERLRRLWGIHQRATALYRPSGKVDAALLLVRCERPERWIGTRMDDEHYGWGRYVSGPIAVLTVPGTHNEILTDLENQRRIVVAINEAVDRFAR